MPQEVTEYEESDEVGSSPLLVGSLRTRLRWDLSNKQLGIDIRQLAESSRALEVKYKGSLNTATGDYAFAAHVKKNFFTNKPSITRVIEATAAADDGADAAAAGVADVNPDAFLPGGLKTFLFKDWILSPGLAMGSAPGHAVNYCLGIRKSPQVLKRFDNGDSWLQYKAISEFNPKTSEVTTTGNVRLKVLKYNITDKQDLKLSLGYDFASHPELGWQKTPYLKLGENSWSVRHQRGNWQFLYEI